MFALHLLSALVLLITLSATATAGAVGPDAGTRLGARHRFAKRFGTDQDRRRWGQGHGGRGGRGGQGRSGGQRKPSSSAAAQATTEAWTQTGKATFFYQEGGTGACGSVHQDSAKIVALQSALYSLSLCGKSLTITNSANGKSVTATVADECPGCSSEYSLDLSTGAFDDIGDEDTGVLSIDWSWN